MGVPCKEQSEHTEEAKLERQGSRVSCCSFRISLAVRRVNVSSMSMCLGAGAVSAVDESMRRTNEADKVSPRVLRE